jgi:hypothetical protein
MDNDINCERLNALPLDEIFIRREQLCAEIENLANKKLQEISAIELCYKFIKQAMDNARLSSDEVASILSEMRMPSLGRTIALSSDLTLPSLSTPISQQRPSAKRERIENLQHHRRVHTTSQCIPPEFGLLGNDHLLLSSDGKKMFAYIYHQFFISVITIVDDYLSKQLSLILMAYSSRIGKSKSPDLKGA